MKRPALASLLFLVLVLPAATGHGEPQPPDSGPLPEVQVNGRANPCVRLHSGASSDRSTIDCLETGTRLRLLGELSNWSQVRLLDGTKGWIDSGYLEAAPASPAVQPAAAPPAGAEPPPDPPRRARLKREVKELKAQLRSAEEANAQQASRIAQLEADLPSAQDRESELRQALAAAEARVATAEQRQAEQAQRIEDLDGELADAERRIAEATLKSRLAGRAEPSAERPAGRRVTVRAPIDSTPEAPKVSVRMPTAVSERAAAPPPERPAEAPIPTTDAAVSAIQAWAAAWSDQRVDDYLSFYAPGFQPPGGLGRGEWEAQRRQRLRRPAFIRVTISDLDAELAEDGTVTATFRQEYESDSFADTVTKVMTLAEEDGAWRLLVERATP